MYPFEVNKAYKIAYLSVQVVLKASLSTTAIKSDLLALASLVTAAGLIQAIPVGPTNYLDVGDNFPVGEPSKNNFADNRDNDKVISIATKFKKGQARVHLTKQAQKDKGFEFIRGKNKIGEESYETANREAYEEGGIHGIPDKKNKITVSYIPKGSDKEAKLDAYIVKIPSKQKAAPVSEDRTGIWVRPDDVKHHIKRPEQLEIWKLAEPILKEHTMEKVASKLSH